MWSTRPTSTIWASVSRTSVDGDSDRVVGYTETPESELETIRSVVESRPVVDTTPGIAKLAGRTNGELKRRGQTVSTGDVIIGATARHYDEPVVTGNPTDLEVIPGVTVERYD